MKKTQEILGLPVVSVSNGIEVGHVKDIVINSDAASIDFLVIDSGIHILNAKVVPTNMVLGIGMHALTIESEKSILDISKVPQVIDLMQKNVLVKGSKILTKKGQLIGKVGDIFVDHEDDCKILGLEFIEEFAQGATKIIPKNCVVTLGKELVIVVDDVKSKLLDDIRLNVYQNQFNNESEITKDEFYEEPDIQSYGNEAIGDVAATKESSAANLFELKQREYLKGKIASKALYSNDGQVIVDEGDYITEELIDMAKNNGKLIELIMNNKA